MIAFVLEAVMVRIRMCFERGTDPELKWMKYEGRDHLWCAPPPGSHFGARTPDFHATARLQSVNIDMLFLPNLDGDRPDIESIMSRWGSKATAMMLLAADGTSGPNMRTIITMAEYLGRPPTLIPAGPP